LPLVKATAAPSLLRAKSAAPESAVSTSTGAAVGTAPAGVTEEGSFTGSLAQQPDAPDAVVRRARVRATEITGGETRADAGIVWRRTANAAANERANATSSTAGGPSGTLMRVEDGGSDTTTTAAPNASTAAGRAEASAGGIDVGEIAEQVIRTISRRMAVERERRGFRK
jgi:hypothetical protein